MKKFLPAVAILVAAIAAIASAQARGGWDGNGLSIGGIDPCALNDNQVNGCR